MGNPDPVRFQTETPTLFASLAAQFDALGIHCYAFGGERALALAKTAGPEAVRAYGLDVGRSLCMLAVPYDLVPLAPESLASKQLRVASFASANHYAAIVRSLSKAAKNAGIREPRIFCNSRIAEKPLAVLSGLGHLGRSSLVVTPEYGSAVLLAGMVLPLDVPAELDACRSWDGNERQLERAMEAGALCASCTACVDACPCGAIGTQSGLDVDSCIQQWASCSEMPPVRVALAWGNRLYGCDECVLACTPSADPLHAHTVPHLCMPKDEAPGAIVQADVVLGSTDEELQQYLRKTALGMQRFSPQLWRKNARLALTWLESSKSVTKHG